MSDILYAGAYWIGPAHPENYFQGRIGYGIGDAGHQYSITAIGLHHTATTLQGVIDTFMSAPASGRQHSAHFIVDLDGTRYQILDTADTAFALGDEAANCYTVNIEVVQTWDFGAGVKTSDFTDAQYLSVGDICRIVAADNGFAPDVDHIHGHNFWTQTTCPADLDIPRVITSAAQEADLTPEEHQLLVDNKAKLDSIIALLGGPGAPVIAQLQTIAKWLGYDANTNPNPSPGADIKAILLKLQTVPPGTDLTPVLDALKKLTLKASGS